MKINNGYLLKKVAGSHVVVPVGNLNFDGLIHLNEVGALLWSRLENECDQQELVKLLLDEYDIDEATARRDVASFLDKLKAENIIHE